MKQGLDGNSCSRPTGQDPTGLVASRIDQGRIAELALKAAPLLNCDHRTNRPNPHVAGERIVGFVIGENDIGLGLSEPLFALGALIELAKIAAGITEATNGN